jgi:hypothetical protein
MGGGARTREGSNVKISEQALALLWHRGLEVEIATWLVEAGGCVTASRKECWSGSPQPRVTVRDLSGEYCWAGPKPSNFEILDIRRSPTGEK